MENGRIDEIQHCVRQDWEKRIREAMQTHGNEGAVDTEWLDASLTDDGMWEWMGNIEEL